MKSSMSSNCIFELSLRIATYATRIITMYLWKGQDVCYPHCTATKIQPVQCTWEKICFWVSNWFVLGLSPVWVPVTVSGCCEQMLTHSLVHSFCRSGGTGGEGLEGSIAPPPLPPDFERIRSNTCFPRHIFNTAWPSDFQTFRRLCLVSSSFICLVFCSLFGFVNLELTSNSYYIFTKLQLNDISENYRVFFVLSICLILMSINNTRDMCTQRTCILQNSRPYKILFRLCPLLFKALTLARVLITFVGPIWNRRKMLKFCKILVVRSFCILAWISANWPRKL